MNTAKEPSPLYWTASWFNRQFDYYVIQLIIHRRAIISEGMNQVLANRRHEKRTVDCSCGQFI